MAGYLYIVSAPTEQGLRPSKVGVSGDARTRLARIRSDSAAPWLWQPWRVYRLESMDLARKLELFIRNDCVLAPMRQPGKLEHFDCRPNEITKRVEILAAENSIELLKDFPFAMSMVREMSGDFPSLPTEILKSLPEDARNAYWLGAQDLLRVLAHMDGLVLESGELWELWVKLKSNADCDEPKLWATVVDHYRNRSNQRNKRIAHDAIIGMADDERKAWEDWQK